MGRPGRRLSDGHISTNIGKYTFIAAEQLIQLRQLHLEHCQLSISDHHTYNVCIHTCTHVEGLAACVEWMETETWVAASSYMCGLMAKLYTQWADYESSYIIMPQGDFRDRSETDCILLRNLCTQSAMMGLHTCTCILYMASHRQNSISVSLISGHVPLGTMNTTLEFIGKRTCC